MTEFIEMFVNLGEELGAVGVKAGRLFMGALELHTSLDGPNVML